MKKLFSITVFLVSFSFLSAQSIFIPNGQSGIGTSLTSGNVGIGPNLTHPYGTLHILNDATSGYSYALRINTKFENTKAIGIIDKNDKEVFTLYGDGRIFTKSIFAESFEVRPDIWMDFVFDLDYNLMPLSEVASYINNNHHLPDIPSEKEVMENGINVAQMDALLLKKIEELTLYIIQQQKEIDQLKSQIIIND